MLKKNKANFYEISELKLPGLIHGFSPKYFGNLSYKYGNKNDVDRNRQNFLQAVEINYSQTAQMDLVHGSKVTIVDKPGLFRETDGLLTNKTGLPLWLLTGDCSPIIFYDPQGKVIGLVHSGRRGTVGKIATICFTKMITNFGSKAENILIGFGPSIEKCHYIKPKPILEANLPEWEKYLFPVGEDKLALDLNGFTIDQLLEVGVQRENIFYSNFCVADHNDNFFSLQMEKAGKDKAGRFASVVCLS